MNTSLLEQIITKEDMKKLEEIRNMIEDIMETIDILLNKEAIQKIKEAEQDIKQGKIKEWKQFLKEIKENHNLL